MQPSFWISFEYCNDPSPLISCPASPCITISFFDSISFFYFGAQVVALHLSKCNTLISSNRETPLSEKFAKCSLHRVYSNVFQFENWKTIFKRDRFISPSLSIWVGAATALTSELWQKFWFQAWPWSNLTVCLNAILLSGKRDELLGPPWQSSGWGSTWFLCRSCGFNPWSGKLGSHRPQPGQKDFLKKGWGVEQIDSTLINFKTSMLKETRNKRMHTLWFGLCKVQEQAKVI